MELILDAENREYWNKRTYLNKELKESIKNADILITPLENFREGVEISFHQGTLNLLSFLEVNLPNSISLEVCAEDENYAEISLHSKQHRLGKILVTAVVVPVLINLLSNYVYDYLNADDNDDVSISLAIEMENCKTYSVEFDGKAKDFDSLKEYTKEVLDRCKINE